MKITKIDKIVVLILTICIGLSISFYLYFQDKSNSYLDPKVGVGLYGGYVSLSFGTTFLLIIILFLYVIFGIWNKSK